MNWLKIPQYICKDSDKTNKDFKNRNKDGDGVSAVIPTIARDKILDQDMNGVLTFQRLKILMSFSREHDEKVKNS